MRIFLALRTYCVDTREAQRLQWCATYVLKGIKWLYATQISYNCIHEIFLK